MYSDYWQLTSGYDMIPKQIRTVTKLNINTSDIHICIIYKKVSNLNCTCSNAHDCITERAEVGVTAKTWRLFYCLSCLNATK